MVADTLISYSGSGDDDFVLGFFLVQHAAGAEQHKGFGAMATASSKKLTQAGAPTGD